MPADDAASGGETLIFTCAGAAHPGQVANRAGVQLRLHNEGTLFCTAAVAAGAPEKLERARQAQMRIAIDGCEDQCCRNVLEKAGLPVDVHVCASDLGVSKEPDSPRLLQDTKTVMDRIEQLLAQRATRAVRARGGPHRETLSS